MSHSEGTFRPNRIMEIADRFGMDKEGTVSTKPNVSLILTTSLFLTFVLLSLLASWTTSL